MLSHIYDDDSEDFLDDEQIKWARAIPIVIDHGNYQTLIPVSAIMYHCYHGNLDEVRRIVALRGNPHCGSKDGTRPIHYACYNGNLELVRYLIEVCNVELSVNKRKNLKWDFGIKKKIKNGTPLDFAILSGNEELINYLKTPRTNLKSNL